jgi:hypothetical protein
MKNFKFEGSGLKELTLEEQHEVSGGFGLILLAAFGGLYTAYNLGKVVGQEAYAISHL